MSNQNISKTKVVTGIVRLSYANLWEPKSINGGTEKYSASLIIPKSDTATIQAINEAIDAAIEEPCQGSKTKELTLREGSRTWTVEIGAAAGPAQTRILQIMDAPMAEYRALAQPSSQPVKAF